MQIIIETRYIDFFQSGINCAKELKMNMKNKDDSSRMKTIFIDYNTLLRSHGPSRLLEENKNIAVQHVLSTILPAKLRNRLDSNLPFYNHELEKTHAEKVCDAFVLVHSGAMNEDVSTAIRLRKDILPKHRTKTMEQKIHR